MAAIISVSTLTSLRRDNQVFQGELNNEFAPKEQKFLRANNSDFLTKNLRKAIMKRSNIYVKERTKWKVSIINKEISAWVFCVKIRDYFGNLNNKIVTDNKNFGKL